MFFTFFFRLNHKLTKILKQLQGKRQMVRGDW